jgi:hypothetical protein
MRGHEVIVAMRRRGSKPPMVRLQLGTFPRRAPDWGLPPEVVFVEPADYIPRLDLLFVVGCLVLVDGQDADRVHALAAAAMDHGAQRVIAHVVRPRGETFDILEITDTEYSLSWHA